MKFAGAAKNKRSLRLAESPVVSSRSAGTGLHRGHLKPAAGGAGALAERPPADEITMAAYRMRKKVPGMKGHPECFIKMMWRDYQRLKSCRLVAKLYGTTRQSVWEMFSRRGLKMNDRKFLPAIIHKGRRYTRSAKGNYWRSRVGRDIKMLHQEIWRGAHGPIPAGHYIGFKDGDNGNCALENLMCMTKRELSLFHYRRRFPDRVNWTAEDRRRYVNDISKRCRDRKRAKRNQGMLLKYFPPVVVKEDRETKTLRRHVARFSPKGALGDLFSEIHQEIEKRRVA